VKEKQSGKSKYLATTTGQVMPTLKGVSTFRFFAYKLNVQKINTLDVVLSSWKSSLAMAKKWGKEDDKHGTAGGGVSTTDLGAKTVQKVNKRHFSDCEYKNFAPLFQKKARAWNLEKTLAGGWGKSSCFSCSCCLLSLI
jgi:hypothetical protein